MRGHDAYWRVAKTMISNPRQPENLNEMDMSVHHEPKSVVLIDDDHYLCDLFRLIMDHHDWNITVFQMADVAISYLHTHNPDFIILDLMLPQLNGWQAFEIIRDTLPDLTSKIIATTAYYSYDTEQLIMKQGFDGYILKPFEPAKLISYLSNLLD